ncbi:hypothetical protein [Paenibacillus sp. FJAT-26967]|uniref:hypothetical protein n=1 Tax=Paenibacillus sp. FJAT-26967 TaxID=1729690 RepID=UPI000B33126D|nr:hypothetical protein [Paenibacillus sp. FJAT-26967]
MTGGSGGRGTSGDTRGGGDAVAGGAGSRNEADRRAVSITRTNSEAGADTPPDAGSGSGPARGSGRRLTVSVAGDAAAGEPRSGTSPGSRDAAWRSTAGFSRIFSGRAASGRKAAGTGHAGAASGAGSSDRGSSSAVYRDDTSTGEAISESMGTMLNAGSRKGQGSTGTVRTGRRLTVSMESELELHVIRRSLEQRGRVEIPSRGTSMLPLIREGSVCTFEPAGPDEVQRGDIVLFEAADGGLIAHRLIRRTGTGSGAVFYCKGDANTGFDPPVAAGNLLARLVQIRRGSREISGGMLRFKLWGRVMTALPGLARVIRLAARLSKQK